MRRPSSDLGIPVKAFLQTFAGQLDLTQDAMRMKVKAGRPLTWALKDIDVDLQVFISIASDGTMRWRTAGPNESGASTVRLSFTTITRSMVEENTWASEMEDDPRSLDVLKQELSPEQLNDLSLIGVRTVSQYKRLIKDNPQAVQVNTGIPVLDLQAALLRASRPTVSGHEVLRDVSGQPILKINGSNLHDGDTPEVKLAGEPVEVLEATPSALFVRPMAHHDEGQVEVFVGGSRVTGFFRIKNGSRERPRADLQSARVELNGTPPVFAETNVDDELRRPSDDPYVPASPQMDEEAE